MSVQNQLARFLVRRCKAHSVNDIVQTSLKQADQVLARHAFLAVSLFKVVDELLLQHAVVSSGLLLLAKLHSVLSDFLVCCAVLTRNRASAVQCALAGGAAVALQKELGAFSAAQSAYRSCISCHNVCTSRNYTRLRLGGLQPLCGIGVTSLIRVIWSPTVSSARIADSRPAPGPLTNTSTVFRP